MDPSTTATQAPASSGIADPVSGKTKTVINGVELSVSSKYKILRNIGSGAYGIVCSALDTSVDPPHKVAVKVIKNNYKDLVDAKRILREIKLLRFFGRHENLVELYDLDEPDGGVDHEDVTIITGLMETDMHRVIYSRQKLSDDHCAYFLYQLLRGLKFMHSANIIHRDLKPSNLLLNSNCDLRICDLGLARGIHEMEGPQKLTEYVVTRWYRAPEIMLAARYSKAADIWSCGTIFAELLRRKPLFPGNDYLDQLRLIIATLGTPTDSDTWYVTSERAKAFLAKNSGKPKVPWSSVIKKANPLALDLLERMLKYNPSERITVEDALRHPYLSTLHCEDDEPCHPAGKYDFSFEVGFRHEKANIQRLIYREIQEFRQERAAAAALEKEQRAAAAAAGVVAGSSSGAAAVATEKKAPSNDPLPPGPSSGSKGSVGVGGAPSSLPQESVHVRQPSAAQRIAAAAGAGATMQQHQHRSSRDPKDRKGSTSSAVAPDPTAAPAGGSTTMPDISPPAGTTAPVRPSSSTNRPVVPRLPLGGAGGTVPSASARPAAPGPAGGAGEGVELAHYQSSSHRHSQSQTERPRGVGDTSGEFAGPAGTGPSHPSGASTSRSPVLLGMTKTADRLRRSQTSATLRDVASAAADPSSFVAGGAAPGAAVPYHSYHQQASSRGGTGSGPAPVGENGLPALPSYRSNYGGGATYRSGSGQAAAMAALQAKDNPLGSPPPVNSARMTARGGNTARGGESARLPATAAAPQAAATAADPSSDGGTGSTSSNPLPPIQGNQGNGSSGGSGGGGGGGGGGGVIKSLFGLLHRGGK